MNTERCLCVFSRILGWGVFGRYVDECLERSQSNVTYDHLDYDEEAFEIRIPWHRNFSAASRATFRLKHHVAKKGIDPSRYNSFIFQGHQLAVPFRRYFGDGVHVRVIADTTPAITNLRVRGRYDPRSLVKRVWCTLQDSYVYRPMFGKVASFLVLSDFVKRSLIDDYGVDAAKIFTVGPPIFDKIAPLPRPEKQRRPVLLFVGNDFERKGGAFLLDLYRRFFAERADLWIVSSRIEDRSPGPGIRVLSNLPHTDVLELMLRSHLFVFPSYHDELGLVLAEAACTGLPIVARESGGQSEYVRDGENGYLLRTGDDSASWRDAIDSILSDDLVRQRFADNSLALARRLCTQQQFDKQFSAFLHK